MLKLLPHCGLLVGLIVFLNIFWHTKWEMSFLEYLYLIVFPNKVVSELSRLKFFFSVC